VDDPAIPANEASSTGAPGPLALYAVSVAPEWVDYNGHMSEWCYLLVMGNSSDAFFRHIGIDAAYRAAGASLYTVETHIRNLREASQGERLALTLQVLGYDSKRVHVAHRILRGDDEVVATGEQMLLHVDTAAGRASALPESVRRRVADVATSHRELDRPPWVGQVMGIPGQAPAATVAPTSESTA